MQTHYKIVALILIGILSPTSGRSETKTGQKGPHDGGAKSLVTESRNQLGKYCSTGLNMVRTGCAEVGRIEGARSSSQGNCLQLGVDSLLMGNPEAQVILDACSFADGMVKGWKARLKAACYSSSLPLASGDAAKNLAESCKERAPFHECVENGLRLIVGQP